MVYVIARPSNKYTGYYKDSRGKVRSAGTYDSEAEAIQVLEVIPKASSTNVTVSVQRESRGTTPRLS